jgi:nuclease S1
MKRISSWGRLRTAIVAWLAFSPSTLFAWGIEGHKAIAIIAMHCLQGTNTLSRISALLGSMTLADVSICPDEVRDFDRYHTPMSATCSKLFPDPPKGTSNWHFINIPIKDASFKPTTADIDAACKQDCVTVEITNFLAILAASKPNDGASKKCKERQALSFVVHFIGDVHQPLHAADRNGDRGGNAEHIKFFNAQAVLHGIWDNEIVSRVDSTEAALSNDLASEITQAAAETASEPTDWALQSYNFAKDVAYVGVPPADGDKDVADLGQPYQDSAAPVVRMQIARAGVRLANALKAALP